MFYISIFSFRVFIYIDDQLVSDVRGLQLTDGMVEIPAPSVGGLFLGGIPEVMEDSIRFVRDLYCTFLMLNKNS